MDDAFAVIRRLMSVALRRFPQLDMTLRARPRLKTRTEEAHGRLFNYPCPFGMVLCWRGSETLPAFSLSLKGEFQMRSRPYRLLLVAVLIGALLLCWSVYAQEKKSSRIVWEYTMVSMQWDETSKLSELGAQGWELAFVR